MRTRSLILGALDGARRGVSPPPVAASAPRGAPPDADQSDRHDDDDRAAARAVLHESIFKERLGYTDDQIAETAGLLETIPPAAAAAGAVRAPRPREHGAHAGRRPGALEATDE